MNKIKCLLSAILWCLPMMVAAQIVSPNGNLSVKVDNQQLTLFYHNQQVLEIGTSSLSLNSLNSSNSQNSPNSLSPDSCLQTDYQMLTGKRLHCTNEANEYRLGSLVLRLYNDGIAFRYEETGVRSQETGVRSQESGDREFREYKEFREFRKEETVYRIPEGTRRWMQQWTEAYEGFFPLSTTYRVKAVPGFSQPSISDEGFNCRWGYPALLEPRDGVFALITEANIERGQSASCLYNDGELYRVVPAERSGEVCPHTPWRVVIVGTLADVVESTLVTDVSEPSRLDDVSWIHPGVVSWIYWAYNHGSSDYSIIRKYVDMAVTLRLPYVLIDAEWDEMKDGKTIVDAVAYARSQGIKPLIWYNSSVGWVDGAPGPKYRLNSVEDREREFDWCERIGVAGVKIDFFSGDNQMIMDYCQDLLESAARHHLLVNFHGATIPRGWQRTWPNLLTTEGVYGAEWYNNVPTFTTRAAQHNATLPFTRNVIGPMDYTPCTFSDSQHPHITSNAHELALTILYESGLQHLADKPESYLAQPVEVQQFLSQLPVAWDETLFLSGYPGESAVLARRSGQMWYIAGINGTDQPMSITLPTDRLPADLQVTQAFLDSGDPGQPWCLPSSQLLPTTLSLLPRGGFVLCARVAL